MTPMLYGLVALVILFIATFIAVKKEWHLYGYYDREVNPLAVIIIIFISLFWPLAVMASVVAVPVAGTVYLAYKLASR